MFTVDVELKRGGSRAVEFPTKAEAVAYAGQMAQDSAVAVSSVRGLAQDASATSGGSSYRKGKKLPAPEGKSATRRFKKRRQAEEQIMVLKDRYGGNYEVRKEGDLYVIHDL